MIEQNPFHHLYIAQLPFNTQGSRGLCDCSREARADLTTSLHNITVRLAPNTHDCIRKECGSANLMPPRSTAYIDSSVDTEMALSHTASDKQKNLGSYDTPKLQYEARRATSTI